LTTSKGLSVVEILDLVTQCLLKNFQPADLYDAYIEQKSLQTSVSSVFEHHIKVGRQAPYGKRLDKLDIHPLNPSLFDQYI